MFRLELIKDELPIGHKKMVRKAVRGIIYYEDKLLMVCMDQGDYKFPGGGIEDGETEKEALHREILEETGFVDVMIGPCIGTAYEQNADDTQPDGYFCMESSYHICKLNSEKQARAILKMQKETPVFCTAAEAYAQNKQIWEEKTEIDREDVQKDDAGLPWLERETLVLERLANSEGARLAWAVYECGQLIKNADRSSVCIDEKEGRANFVTAYDKMVQARLKERFGQILPEAVFVGEEEDIHASIKKGTAFIVDPIDGTTNFIKDYKCSCISVGMTVDGERTLGIVYHPYLDELFFAEKGCGAYKNGERIFVSDQPLSNGIVLFGTAPYYEELSKKSFELAYQYFNKALDIRRSGSAAIDLCSIACGRAELYFELMLSPWDYAAGALIVEEAGGKVTTVEGMPITLHRPCSIKATNGMIRLDL